MEPWMTVLVGILVTAVFAGVARWKAAGEPTDFRKAALTIAFGVALSLGVSFLQLYGVSENDAYPVIMLLFSMAGLTMTAEYAAKGTSRRMAKPAAEPKKLKKKKLRNGDGEE